jgi:ankyrin repeat protein
MSLDVMFSDPSVRLLAKAAGEGKIETIDRLVAEGVNVNSRGTQNVTPLYWALRDYNGFSHLLSLGADPNVVYGDGGTVMHWAAQKKDIRFLKTALQYGGNPNLVNQDASKQTPIFSALYMGVTHVDVLLDGGANIDAVDQQGCTPVIYAVNAGWYDLAYELLIRGADYRMPDHQHGGSLLANQVGWIRSTVRPNSKEAERLGRIVNWLEAHGVKVPSSGWWGS